MNNVRRTNSIFPKQQAGAMDGFPKFRFKLSRIFKIVKYLKSNFSVTK